PRSGRAVHRRWPRRPGRGGARRGDGARGVPARRGRRRRDPASRAGGECRWSEGSRKGHGTSDAQVQGPGGRQAGEPDRPRGAGGRRMTGGGGVAPSVLETLEFPAALERVAAHAAGPLGAARVTRRSPATDPDAIRAALGQVAELAALLLTDDAIRAEPVPDITAALELLGVPGSAREGAVTVREGRYVIPVRSTARARIGGIVHDESATRATVFIEPPEVIELGNALRAAELDEQREVLQVLRDLTELLRPHRDAIAAAWEMCLAFDDLCARARYAVEVNGFAPTIGTGPLEIRNGRHPLLASPPDPLSAGRRGGTMERGQGG